MSQTDEPLKHYALLENIPVGPDRLLYVTLQGLANRSSPELYLQANASTDGHWVRWYRKYGLEPQPMSLDKVFARFLPQTRGAYVIGAQDSDWEIPLAVSLAGLHNRVLVTPAQANLVRSHGAAVDELPIPRFASRLEAMAWAISTLRPQTSPDLLHSNSFPRPSANIDIVDLIVSCRGFSYSLTTNPATRPGERDLLGQLFAAAPPFTQLLGWHQADEVECSYIDFASRYGLLPFCTTFNLNFSFHRHVPAQGECRQSWPQPDELPALDHKKCYVTFVFSDGDAPHSMADLQKGQWDSPLRGKVPFGWAIPPEMVKLGPAMLEYYFQTRTQLDELLCGPSGIGYIYFSHWADQRNMPEDRAHALRAEFLRRTNERMEKLNLTAMWPINRVVQWLPDGRMLRRLSGKDVWVYNADHNPNLYGIDHMDDGVILEYCTRIPQSRGFFQGWHTIPHEQERVINGRAYFPCKLLAEQPNQALTDIARFVGQAGTPCFIPVHVNCYEMGMEGVHDIITRLDPTVYEVLLPTAFLELAARARGLA